MACALSPAILCRQLVPCPFQHFSSIELVSGLKEQCIAQKNYNRSFVQRKTMLRKTLLNSNQPQSTSSEEDFEKPPPGCTRIKVELTKPLGIVLEEDKSGNILVVEVLKDGNAYKTGLVEPGDQLIAISAVVYSNEERYQEVMVKKGMQVIRLNVRGEKFETVMAAIGTHPAYIKVSLEFQKCQPVPKVGNNGSLFK